MTGEPDRRLVLRAPLAGWAAPLDEVPDPVFAQRMLGDGIAIDPTGSMLHAPCDGEVLSIHRAGHAVTLRATAGAELVMHVGLETVALDGEGFEKLVAAGQQVRTGDPLLRFDLDLLARKAKSLITPIVVTNGDAFRIVRAERDRPVAVGDLLMELEAVGPIAVASAIVPNEAAGDVRVPLRHGIHARPAATLAARAKEFEAELTLLAGTGSANLRSPAALLALGVQHGQNVTVKGRGADADAAVAAILALIGEGMGEAAPIPEKAPSPLPTDAVKLFAGGEQAVLRGVKAAPGLGIGIAVRIDPPALAPPEDGAGRGLEHRALDTALAAVRGRLVAALTDDEQKRGVLTAHLGLIDDPEIVASARTHIDAGRSAGRGWQLAVDRFVTLLSALADARLRERGADLRDLERQVLLALGGGDGTTTLPERAILVGEELLPMQLALLDRSRIAGICTAGGGPTSHVAILAASAGIPAIVAAGPDVLRIADGTPLILDADQALLEVNPADGAAEATLKAIEDRRRRHAANIATAQAPCRMADGTRIEVFANLGSEADVVAALANGAEGSGLLRTEFLFQDRATAPDEDEQHARYQAIARALGGRPLIIRTLDAGADKPLPYIAMPPEENPALGIRGIRVGLRHPEMLRAQLRAILRLVPHGQCRIMLPMVASLTELRAVRAVYEAERALLGVGHPVELGIMVETPAAAVLAEQFAAEADFLSIGTNDLTQYVLAMDRMNPLLAGALDAYHPAVLRMIELTCAGAARHGRQVGVCGGLASEPLAAPLLIGLGVTELSATAAAVPDVKAAIRPLVLERCRELAQQALEQATGADVRRLLAGEAGA